MSSERNSVSTESRLRQVCAELDGRLRRGESCRAEEYLASLGDLAADPEFALELIYTEYTARERCCGPQRPEEWFERFPQWREPLSRLIELHELVHHKTGGHSTDDGQNWARAGDTPADGSRDSSTGTSVTDKRIGQYQLLELIGQGGMGVVYKARQLGVDRIVAVKLIIAVHATPQQRVRFQMEASTAARLQHPNIVQIYEIGEQNGVAYLSMEFVRGSGLDKKLAEAPLSARVAAELIEILARAMQFAHERGVVHRDLKPANILLQVVEGQRGNADNRTDETWNGLTRDTHRAPLFPKIVDFGLAKRLEADSGETRTGQVLGTPSYMAPEQASGKNAEVGPHSDVYALGVILYEALAGRPPFLGETPLDTLEQIRSQDPLPPSRLKIRLPRDLETICLKCLAKVPGQRYASAGDLAEDLSRYLRGEPIRARRIGVLSRVTRWCYRKPLTAGLIAALALALVGGFAGILSQWLRAEQQAAAALFQRGQADDKRLEAERQRTRAQAHLAEARQLVDVLTTLSNNLIQPGTENIRRTALEAALKSYEELLQGDQKETLLLDTARASMNAGSLYLDLGQLPKAQHSLELAIQLLEDAAQQAPEDHVRRLDLARSQKTYGDLLRRLERPADAETAYTRAIELCAELLRQATALNVVGHLVASHASFAALLAQQQRWDEAIEQFREVEFITPAPIPPITVPPPQVRTTPDDRVAAVYQKYGANKPRHMALTFMAQFIRENKELAERLQELAAAFRATGRFDECESALIRLITVRSGPFLKQYSGSEPLGRAYSRLGDLLIAVGRLDEASKAFDQSRVILNEPVTFHAREELARATINLARSLSHGDKLQAHKVFRQSIVELEQLLATSPDASGLDQLTSDYIEYGTLCAEIGEHEEAENVYRQAIANCEKLADQAPAPSKRKLGQAHRRLARLFQVTARYSEAAAEWQHALKLNENSASDLNNLAWLLATCPDAQMIQGPEAVRMARRAVELAPKKSNYWNTLGVALYRAGELRECIAALEQSISIAGRCASADAFFLAMAHWRLKEFEHARAYYDQAVEWMTANAPQDQELLRFRSEADSLLMQ